MSDSAVPNPENLIAFDFITDEKFRIGLISDYRETLRCLDSGAWKAVHVLAGSIVEAVLVDYLVASDNKTTNGKDPLTLELAAIIEACRKEGVLSQKTADLCSVVRAYRNLVHPGRMLRLKEKVNSKTASIAKSLVDIVVEEIAEARKDTYGYTAQQLLTKVEKDPSCLTIFNHLLRETKDVEKERLLAELIPRTYFAALDDDSDPCFGLADLERCFRLTFDTLSDEKKSALTRGFMKILKEEDQKKVLSYQTAFFRASDLKYVQPTEAQVLKEHLLGRLSREQSNTSYDLLIAVDGIGPFLTDDECFRVTDTLLKCVVYARTNQVRETAKQVVEGIYWEASGRSHQDRLLKRLDAWVALCEERELSDAAAGLKKIKDSLEIPF